MKKTRIIAVIIAFILVIYPLFFSYDFYKAVFKSIFQPRDLSMSISAQVYGTLRLLNDLLLMIMSFIFFFSANAAWKDKAYKLVRFVFVMGFILHIPMTFNYLTSTLWLREVPALNLFFIFTIYVLDIVAIVLFFIGKPANPVKKIDLSDYELVSYTSMGHRFLHYLLDILFLLPVWFLWVNFLDESQYFLFGLYILYCFLSEAIFRQTFGKIITNSCVVSNGINLTAGRVLLRNICRLIPFNGISFLFRANWHDKISSTSVVYVDTWEKVFEDNPA